MASIPAVVPSEQTDSISQPEAQTELIAEAPVQAATEIENELVESPASQDSPIDSIPTEIVVARVNGTDIGEALLYSYLNQLAPPEQLAQWDRLEDVPQNILIQGINNAALDNLLVQLAVESDLDQNPFIQANIEQNRRYLLKTAYLDMLAPGLVNERDIVTQYAILVASLQGKQEYHARHILLANEHEAEIVDKALEEKKKSFDELAKQFSLDEATSHRGGDLGYVLDGQLNLEFETAVEKLEIGQISKPFKTGLGWHIAMVEDRREARPMSLDAATPVIRRKLEQQAIQRHLSELLGSAEIEMLVGPGQAE
jgi:peptidyl-prolyl cis-trans isomerase C